MIKPKIGTSLLEKAIIGSNTPRFQDCPAIGNRIGPLLDPVTWYGINYAGTQITQWDFQNKGKSGWTGKSSFVLDELPLRYLRPNIIYSVPCDWILQRGIRFCFAADWNCEFYRPITVSRDAKSK